MRNDMYKVIVERPRARKGDYVKAARRRDDFEGPSRLGMRAGYGRPGLNENLRPLKRFLHSRVGRPWDKVMSEIAANIDRRNTVQQHIYTHIKDFVAQQVEWRYGYWINLEEARWPGWTGKPMRQQLLVDPRTGILRPNKAWKSYGVEKRERLAAERARIAERRRCLSTSSVLLLLDGVWFAVQFAPLPRPKLFDVVHGRKITRWRRSPAVFDAVLKRRVSREACDSVDRRQELYGSDSVYAVSKRQLGRRELTAHGLRSN